MSSLLSKNCTCNDIKRGCGRTTVVSHCLLGFRVQKATESLKTFQPAANPSFDEFILDTSKEESLLKDLSFGGGKHENGMRSSVPIVGWWGAGVSATSGFLIK